MERFRPRPAQRSFFWQRRSGEFAEYREPLTVSSFMSQFGKGFAAWIERTFPERQIYVRSDGRVQFFTFGSSLQALLAGALLVFLLWVAFATVNVLFRGHVLMTKDQRYRDMQTAYQHKLADLRSSYDGLNGALATAQGRFKATADKLETKQNAIANLLQRKAQVEAAIAPDLSRKLAIRKSADNASMDETPSLPEGAESALEDGNEAEQGGALSVLPYPVAPQPRTAKPDHAGLWDRTFAKLARMAASVFPAQGRDAPLMIFGRHPELKRLAQQTARLKALADDDTKLMDQSGAMLADDIGRLRELVKETGINDKQLQQRLAPESGMGGPEIPLDQAQLNGLDDEAFNTAYLKASAILNQLESLTLELRHLPLTLPVESDQVDLSSGFGPRLDPFTRRYAFHPGMDFAGPWGTSVHATAAGTVIYAGQRGSYGNMVEIDHGMGLHTRYGHLSAISVRVGMKIEKGAAIGRLGSTGRSTGPHVHYEVWYDDKVRNPANFIEAGRHVF